MRYVVDFKDETCTYEVWHFPEKWVMHSFRRVSDVSLVFLFLDLKQEETRQIRLVYVTLRYETNVVLSFKEKERVLWWAKSP